MEVECGTCKMIRRMKIVLPELEAVTGQGVQTDLSANDGNVKDDVIMDQ